MSGSNLHSAWAQLFVRALAQAGVRDVVLCPGSRSTPLAIAAAESEEVRCHAVIDERAAAFFALGQARVTGRPSVFVCTSGTAGAHALPAIIEARQSFTPFIAITADRPWELADTAAPQTIDQVKLFGDHVRHFAELGLPDPSPLAMRAAARIAAQAVSMALSPTPGPVHVNARFRKPLEPVHGTLPEPWQGEWEALMRRGGPRVVPARAAVDARALEEIALRCARAERGLIVCGPAPSREDDARARASVIALARATGFPVLAEGTSQIYFGGLAEGAVMPASFDAFLRAPEFRAARAPDLILELGAPPTSAGYATYIAEHAGCRRFVVSPHGWNDPTNAAAALVMAEPADVCEALAARLAGAALDLGRARKEWAAAFARAGEIAAALSARVCAGDELTEGAVARAVAAACPEGSLLAIGNSMPVRDLDTYCPPSARALRVLHQRGASGIDGLVSAAAGARAAAGAPVTLLLGDLSLLHDLTGLLLAAKVGDGGAPLVIVVVQNDGGRIFEHLPIARSGAELLERCFTMPQHLDFAPAAAMFGLAYERATTAAGLGRALAAAYQRPGATLIEAVVPPQDGAARAARLWSDLRREIAAPSGAAPADGAALDVQSE
ncbi:2-succinyl-5-enolpyruvyl-6-hydroxy-3- cyclohexene-1-carboxylate synthase [Sorangium cellulosum]|uniref:2-succinyl-5-enolpyruvyl-6-hydroxy-3-cyclohexene-1-carboxylate synthase n=1 Tax=Sorangium cellulosum TaxID=56 RepID=A0A2L0ERZ0_SORCE|nr:2-succinyl-5-enolpyruvyl-6-hydroxy-3-cyclohexene-1-carboxylic-acid synthase [Sorangium cellulosum]AUX42030.1 2-succinyl-5-enolpyruvyl-6-hydroxy-3- cyclohexene-1-carboxylate synthase [Sorangium cellulosum]